MHKFNKSFQLICGALFTLILVACGGGSDDGGSLTGPKNFGDCTNSPYEGSAASLSSFNYNIVNSGYFGKTLSQDQLDGLLTASSSSIVSVLKQQGVQVFQIIEDPQASCQYYSFLEAPTSNAQDSWNSQSPQTGNSVLLGLFTTYFYRQPNTGKAWLGEPTIMLRHDTQKWTLLHEMTHYLFAKGRTNEPNMPFDGDLLKKLLSKGQKIQNLNTQWEQNPTAELAEELVEAYQSYRKTDHRLDARQGLEEFTIESMLVERAQQNMISSINVNYNLRNAHSYMKSNSDKIRQRYIRFIDKLSSLGNSIGFQGIATVETQDNLTALIESTQASVDFIDKKLSSVFRIGNDLGPMSNLPMGESFLALPRNIHSHIDIEIVKEQNQVFETLFQ